MSVENGKCWNGRIHYIMDITHGLFLAGIRQTLLVFRGIYLLGAMVFFSCEIWDFERYKNDLPTARFLVTVGINFVLTMP